ncbi:hypothetical protein GCM10019059_43590 [Camelimonas fluminis]|uniref:Uncharacterized protein n=1 Tax=Camelimonas fluminis TaxID=1576911 RepID=A0ABV7UBP0_9HYPH|nr:hypothetical protein [Camelimonas fluminis]GHE80728.1 hypothetical protein GCM10019059_43590 [Camelimonas fluminis]
MRADHTEGKTALEIDEEQTARIEQLARRIGLAAEDLEEAITDLIASPLVEVRPGVIYFERIPVLLDLVVEAAREVRGLAKDQMKRF